VNTVAGRQAILLTFVGSALLVGCDVSVGNGERGKARNVDISTPVGDLSVRTNTDTPDTGLPVYPGAQPLRDDEDEARNANVEMGAFGFGLEVIAAKFESGDTQQAIVDFYKGKMQSYGTVTECRGEIDFEGPEGAKQPTCKSRATADDIQLVAGTEKQHRIVSVKPRANGSELALVSVQMSMPR
jgi:hypothetical protein